MFSFKINNNYGEGNYGEGNYGEVRNARARDRGRFSWIEDSRADGAVNLPPRTR
jgi:hypothetical protein